MLTELGKILKIICTKADIKQKEMAKSLGIATGKLSNILAGKTVPDMDLLGKCIDHYQVKGKEIKDLFSSAFSSTAKHNHTIVLDTRHFKQERIDMLIKVITALLLHKEQDSQWVIKGLERDIKNFYNNLDIQLEYIIPPQEEGSSKV
ncbi:hypothetical protein AGMMS49546_28280 [Spirochaetia bacterium]|nr:hypothetical protein AGMMS49546_28280 [Spirochaetia bacterium]